MYQMAREDDERFYLRCAEILDVQTEVRPFPYYKRTRWNNRVPGSGRFPGRGLVRLFGNTVHITLREPPINRVFESRDEALEFLEEVMR